MNVREQLRVTLGDIAVVFIPVRCINTTDLGTLLASATGPTELHLTMRMHRPSLILAEELFGQREYCWLHVDRHSTVVLYVHAAELMLGQDPFRVMRCFGFLAGRAIRMEKRLEYISFVNITNSMGKHCCFDISSSSLNENQLILYKCFLRHVAITATAMQI